MAAPVWLLEQSHSVSVPQDIYHQIAQKKYQVHDQSTVTCDSYLTYCTNPQ